jgi:hypothetical protein
MGGACGTHAAHEKCIKFLFERLKGRDHSKELGVNGRIILKINLREER